MAARIAVIALLGGCATSPAHAPSTGTAPATAPAATREAPVALRVLATGEPQVDATWDRAPPRLEATRGARRAATKVLYDARADLERCYARELAASGTLSVAVKVTVGSGGRVTSAQAEGARDTAAACAERVLEARLFADPGRDRVHVVEHVFHLRR